MIPCRTRLILLSSVLVTAAWAQEAQPPAGDAAFQAGPLDAITDVPGVRVGHYTHTEGTWRGTTALLFGEWGGLCAVDVRGSNPLTFATSTFSPLNIGQQCDAVVLTGGSAFGIHAVAGVVQYLSDQGKGVQTRAGRVPIVPGAVIFDLPLGDRTIHPRPEWGYRAAAEARPGPVPQGNVGAGTGGTMGKNPGGVRMKGGLGTASAVLPEGAVVGALVVLNALGDIVHPETGELYARSGGFDRVPYRHRFAVPAEPAASPGENTTLAVVATNARLDKTQLTKVAELAHNGLARAIRPVHTMLDGDTIFVVSVGWGERIRLEADYPGEEVDRIGTAAADLLVRAILKGAEAAESIPGWPSYRDWLRQRHGQAASAND